MTAPARPVLALSLKEAIIRGLENNADLAIERLTVRIARAAVDVPRGEFDLLLFSDGFHGRNRDPFFASNPFGGPINPVTGLPAGLVVNPSDASHLALGIRAKTLLGTALELRYDVNRRTTENVFALSPSYTPLATVLISQPLLRGFGIDINRAFIDIARNERRISQAAFRDQALALALAIEEAYWGYVFAHENLKVAEMALATARDLLRLNQERFQVGRVAKIEVLVAETGVATRREAVIIARNEVLNARDNLFRLIMPTEPRVGTGGAGLRSSWDVDLLATDEPRAEDGAADAGEAFRLALENRPDYRQVVLRIRNDETRVARAENDRLPRLDATGSWSQLGLGKSWGVGTKEQFDGDFYEWQIGFTFELPIFNSAARAQVHQARLSREQSRLLLESIEQNIAFEVRTAVRNIAASQERVRATDVARLLAESQLENEKQRRIAGLATNHDVLLFEQELTAARTQHVKAQIDLAVARARLLRVTATLLDRHDVRIRD